MKYFEQNGNNICTYEITIEESLKQRLEFICESSHTTPTFIND